MEDKNFINENNHQEEPKNDFIQEVNLTVTLSFYNKEIENFRLPFYLEEFHSQFLSLYNISSPKVLSEPIYLIYQYSNEQGQIETAQAKTDAEYTLMLSRLKESKLEESHKIFVEASRYPPGVGREEPKDFEGEIRMVVERELKIAEENIKKSLVGKKVYKESTKRQNYKCSKCKEDIIGDMYREVMKDEDNFYCENCASHITLPLFVIH